MGEIKCPCGLRNHMEEEDCEKTNCNACCPLTKPQTNADRIRAMSDEELAELLYGFCWNGEHCYSCPLFNKDCGGINGVEAWNKWLKQPAEVE